MVIVPYNLSNWFRYWKSLPPNIATQYIETSYHHPSIFSPLISQLNIISQKHVLFLSPSFLDNIHTHHNFSAFQDIPYILLINCPLIFSQHISFFSSINSLNILANPKVHPFLSSNSEFKIKVLTAYLILINILNNCRN